MCGNARHKYVCQKSSYDNGAQESTKTVSHLIWCFHILFQFQRRGSRDRWGASARPSGYRAPVWLESSITVKHDHVGNQVQGGEETCAPDWQDEECEAEVAPEPRAPRKPESSRAKRDQLADKGRPEEGRVKTPRP